METPTDKFRYLSQQIQELLRPYHVMPAINTLISLDWINAGLDPDKQILPVMADIVARKVKAGNQVPTHLKYYDSVIRGLNKSPEPNKINENDYDRDLRLAGIYRWKLNTIKGKDWSSEKAKLSDLENKYGVGFGL